MEQLQKRGSLDKDKQENSQQALVRVIESKYNAKMREMLETHNAVTSEHQGRARRLEGELKALQERLQMVERSKQGEAV